jgi:hypothetical protein
MTRYKGLIGDKPNWQVLEKQELEVTYQNRKVRYHLLKVDDKARQPEKRVKKGYYLPGGEFAALNMPFDPKAAADFAFDHRESRQSRNGCVFRYRVPLERTNVTFGDPK